MRLQEMLGNLESYLGREPSDAETEAVILAWRMARMAERAMDRIEEVLATTLTVVLSELEPAAGREMRG
jgi:hypothetical protein